MNITFVNYAGQRTTVPGMLGDTLLSAAVRNKYPFVDGACGGGGAPQDVLHKEGEWYEPKYGEGASCFHCHVIIPKSHYDLLPSKRPDELAQLQQDAEDADRLEQEDPAFARVARRYRAQWAEDVYVEELRRKLDDKTALTAQVADRRKRRKFCKGRRHDSPSSWAPALSTTPTSPSNTAKN